MWTANSDVPFAPGVLAAASRAGRAFVFILSSVAEVYGFVAVADAGRKVIRRLFWLERTLAEEEGRPMEEEAGLDWEEDPEDAAFELARRLTGIDVARHESWAGVRFAVAAPRGEG
jgi:hypothetical protein